LHEIFPPKLCIDGRFRFYWHATIIYLLSDGFEPAYPDLQMALLTTRPTRTSTTSGKLLFEVEKYKH
jgi:hypothetical protein